MSLKVIYYLPRPRSISINWSKFFRDSIFFNNSSASEALLLSSTNAAQSKNLRSTSLVVTPLNAPEVGLKAYDDNELPSVKCTVSSLYPSIQLGSPSFPGIRFIDILGIKSWASFLRT